MKKKALAAVLVAAVTMSMAGCGSKTAETTAAGSDRYAGRESQCRSGGDHPADQQL